VPADEAEALASERLADAAKAAEALASDGELSGRVAAAGRAMAKAYADGRKTILMGNGGSAAQATHLAGELVGRYLEDRAPLPALALADSQSNVTAIANDYSFEEVFARQVKAFAQPGDVVVGISTSGRSADVIRGLEAAREVGAVTIGLTGGDAAELDGLCDHLLAVSGEGTPRIQEGHAVIGHILCEIVERSLGESSS
jgi:D-sedoheptulose 7-phosphate isomerase